MQGEAVRAETTAKRYHFIDWLRVGAVLGIFLLHSTRFFVPERSPIQNVPISPVASFVFVFLHLWVVPMLFCLAGASCKLATDIRSPAAFLRERFTRLVIPYLFGVLFLAPWMSYLGDVHQGKYQGPFPQFWAHSLATLPLRPSPGIA